ncbi:MAG: LysM peptidoglycan-binding domain-containing protein [Gudongella sp.]|nr:LysM peptidoglycan-binding domain-containing protein [Gudongella sp.]
MKAKRYRIRSKSRFFLFITFTLALLAIIVVSIVSSTGAYSIESTHEIEHYWVQQGDTLWDIAREFSPEGYDIREMIYKIKEQNNMDTSMIIEGVKLEIPLLASK